jgi:hypothetical protein
MSTSEEIVNEISEATRGFDLLFANQLDEARKVFGESEYPFRLMGRGVCAFLQVALGMEVRVLAIKVLRC